MKLDLTPDLWLFHCLWHLTHQQLLTCYCNFYIGLQLLTTYELPFIIPFTYHLLNFIVDRYHHSIKTGAIIKIDTVPIVINSFKHITKYPAFCILVCL